MKYPTIAVDDVRQVATDLLDEAGVDMSRWVRWVGEGADLDLAPIESTCQLLVTDLEEFRAGGATDKDEFEGRASSPLHQVLSGLPLNVLDDPGFWRYLAVAQLWDVVRWREESAFRKDWVAYRVYIDGRRHAECVPLRMFLRGQIAERAGDYSLASSVPQATDLWRSHIVRVRTSYSPILAQGLLLQMQGDQRMNTDELRAFAKRIQRVSSNVVLHVYDTDDVTQLLTELRDA
jgi:hypothetical protein